MSGASAIGRLVARVAAWLCSFSYRNALAVTIGTFLLAGLAFWVAQDRLGINTSTDDMLSAELPFRQADARLKSEFPMLDETLVVVVGGGAPGMLDTSAERLAAWMHDRPQLFRNVFYPEGDPFLVQHGLLYLSPSELQDLVDRLAQSQALLATLAGDPSLRGLSSVLGLALQSGADLGTTRLPEALEEFASTVNAAADGKAGAIAWREQLQPRDEDRPDFRLIVAQPVLDYSTLAPARVAMEAVQEGAQALGLTDLGVTVELTGKPAMKADELASVRGNLLSIGGLSFFFVVTLLWWGLGSLRYVGAFSIVVLCGLALTAGFATVSVGTLNLISVAFAVLFIGMSDDYGVHFLLRIEEQRNTGIPAEEAVREAAREHGPPVALCAATTALAFLSFLPTDYRGLAELGIISAGGVFIALTLSVTLLPALVRLVGAPAVARRYGGFAGRVERSIMHRRGLTLAAALAIAVAGGVAMTQISFEDDPLSLRDPGSPSVMALSKVLADSRAQPFTADILRDNLEEADALAARLETLPQVDKAITVSDLVPKDQEEKLAILQDASFLLAPLLAPAASEPPPDAAERQAETRGLIDLLRGTEDGAIAAPAQALAAALQRVVEDPARLAVAETALIGDLPQRLDDLAAALEAGPASLDNLPVPLVRRYLSPDGTARIEVRPTQDLLDREARHDFVTAVRQVAPDAGGDAVAVTEGGDAVLGAFAQAGAVTLLGVALLVLLVLQRFSDMALTLLPLFLASLIVALVGVLLGLKLNFANVIVLPLLFGLGVNSALHLVARRREEPDEPLLENSTPRAIFFSMMTTTTSFGALALSDHPGTASMGLLLMIALLAVLFSTFLLLPALIGRKGAAPPVAGPSATG